jgi:hypothetical protein
MQSVKLFDIVPLSGKDMTLGAGHHVRWSIEQLLDGEMFLLTLMAQARISGLTIVKEHQTETIMK